MSLGASLFHEFVLVVTSCPVCVVAWIAAYWREAKGRYWDTEALAKWPSRFNMPSCISLGSNCVRILQLVSFAVSLYVQKYIFFFLIPAPYIIIYSLTNDCTIISNTIITNNTLLHVSTFKMSSSGSSLCLAKITYRFSGLSKIKLLKYKMINFNKMLIVQPNKRFT